MMQADGHTVWKRVGFERNVLIGTAMVGVLHDVAGGLVHGQLQRRDVVLVETAHGDHPAEVAHEHAGTAEIREIAAYLQLGSRERLRALALSPRRTSDRRSDDRGKRHRCRSDGIHQCARLELTVELNAFDEAVQAEQLAVGIPHLRDAVRIEEKEIPRLERHGNLIEDLSLTNAQRQTVAVHHVAHARAAAHHHHPGVPAVDQVEDAPLSCPGGRSRA